MLYLCLLGSVVVHLFSVSMFVIADNIFCSLLQSSRKETVLDLAKFVDKGVQVKLTGGRQGFLSALCFSNAISSFHFVVQ